jgi:L-arabinokinase
MNSSYPIVFYVSGHGFGHTSRTIEVIHEVLKREPAARVVVKTSAPRRLFDRTLESRIDLIEQRCDAGMIQLDSLNVDTAGSIQAARDFQARVPELIEREIAFLTERNARHVVSDIPPMAFRAAAGAGVPSTGISNFSWDWIYEGYPETNPFDLAREIREMYQQANRVLRLPMAGGFAGLDAVIRDIPFVARQSRRDPDDVRRMLGLPDCRSGRPLLVMSFGGYGVEGLNRAALAALEGYVVASADLPVSRHAIRDTSGVVGISEEQLYAMGLRYEDLIRAADVVVTKPGYGIISEAIANDTAILYTSRGRFIEYDVLVREMPRYLRAQYIEREDLLAGNWGPALERLLNQPDPPERPTLNGAEVAAEAVLRNQ